MTKSWNLQEMHAHVVVYFTDCLFVHILQTKHLKRESIQTTWHKVNNVSYRTSLLNGWHYWLVYICLYLSVLRLGGLVMIFGAVRLLEMSLKVDKGDECIKGTTDKISRTQ